MGACPLREKGKAKFLVKAWKFQPLRALRTMSGSGCQRQLYATKCLLQHDDEIVKQTYVPSLL